MYICITHIDALTGIPCTIEPMARGPAFPNIKGLTVMFANESEWPTYTPLFYCICEDDADINIPGVIKILSQSEYDTEKLKESDIQANKVLEQRDILLDMRVNSIDQSQLDTMSNEQKQAIEEYKNQLLNIAQQPEFPWKISWPTLILG